MGQLIMDTKPPNLKDVILGILGMIGLIYLMGLAAQI